MKTGIRHRSSGASSSRDLTPETHGNAIGIGLADVTTSRLVRAMDLRVTYLNALTALTPQSAKIPIHFETDREAIERLLDFALASRPSRRSPRPHRRHPVARRYSKSPKRSATKSSARRI